MIFSLALLNDCNFQIGIIGGSGLDNPSLLENRMEKLVDTPYGKVRNKQHHAKIVKQYI